MKLPHDAKLKPILAQEALKHTCKIYFSYKKTPLFYSSSVLRGKFIKVFIYLFILMQQMNCSFGGKPFKENYHSL